MTTETAEREAIGAAGDAGAEHAADAADANLEVAGAQEGEGAAEAAPVDLESARASYFQDGESKGSGEGAPESAQRQAAEQALLTSQRAELRTVYEKRQTGLDALKDELLDAGVPESYATRIVKGQKDLLNEHHADALRLGAGERVLALTSQFWDSAYDALPKEMHADLDGHFEELGRKHSGNVPLTEIGKTLVDFARRGYMPEKDSKVKAEAAFTAGFNAGRGVGESSQTSADAGNVARSASSGRSVEEAQRVLEDLNSSQEAKARAYEIKHGFKPS